MADGETAAARDAFIAASQRDLNGLVDADRPTRRRSLEKLGARLLDGDGPSAPPPTPDVLAALMASPAVGGAACRLLSDAVEKIRELAATLLSRAAAALPSSAPLLQGALPALASRLAGSPPAEPSEEIRLQLTTLAGLLASRALWAPGPTTALSPYVGEVAAIAGRMLGDPYHDIKKAACALLEFAAAALPPGALSPHARPLIAALGSALGHQHQKVRTAAVGALQAIVLAGGAPPGAIVDAALPAVRPLAGDKLAPVRAAAVGAVAAWCRRALASVGEATGESPPPPLEGTDPPTAAVASSLVASLLPPLLLGVTDEAMEVAAAAAEHLAAVGRDYDSLMCATTTAGDGSVGHDAAAAEGVAESGLPPGLRGPGAAGARRMMAALLPTLLPPALRDLREWTSGARAAAARVVHALMALSGGPAIAARADVLVPALCAAVGDDSPSVAGHVVAAARLLGAQAPPRAWVGLGLEAATADRATPGTRASCLVILAALLRAASPGSLSDEAVTAAAAALAGEELRGCDHPGVRAQLLAVATNLMSAAGGRLEPASPALFHVLLQLRARAPGVGADATAPGADSGDDDTRLAAGAQSAIGTLATACGLPSAEALYGRHAGTVLASLASGAAGWSGGTHPSVAVLSSLLLHSPPSVLASHAPLVVTLLAAAGEAERDPALRIALLRLTDAVMEDPSRGPALTGAGGESAAVLLAKVLLPPCVWSAGKATAAVRYAAVVALGTALRRRLLPPPVVAAALSAGMLLPPLTACLEEDWYADTRAAAAHALEQLLLGAGAALSGDQRRAVYPELHKRLDDSSDAIRVAAAACCRAFFSTLPADYDDANAGYALQGVLVHLDDASPAVQEAVCGAVLAAAAAKPQLTAGAVAAVRGRHRSPEYCDRVLAACAGKT